MRLAEHLSLPLIQFQQRTFGIGKVRGVQHLKSRIVLAIERSLRRWAASLLSVFEGIKPHPPDRPDKNRLATGRKSRRKAVFAFLPHHASQPRGNISLNAHTHGSSMRIIIGSLFRES